MLQDSALQPFDSNLKVEIGPQTFHAGSMCEAPFQNTRRTRNWYKA
jgi:hypothetical protein